MGNHIAQYPAEYSLCLGCESCKLVCGLLKDGVTGPAHGCIQLDTPDYKQLIFRVLSCEQCSDHPCYEACPKKDEAMCLDEKTGIVYINEDACIGCGLCARNCKLTPSRIVVDRQNKKAKKCDLCRNRPEGPACVETCPVKCLGLSADVEAWKEAQKHD